MSVQEWEALPWHIQQAYKEGLDWEFNPDAQDEEEGGEEDLTNNIDGLSRYGISVKHV